MKNKLEIKRHKRWFRDPEYSYRVVAGENGQVICPTGQRYSRRLDLETNIRRLFNADIVAQLDAWLAKQG